MKFKDIKTLEHFLLEYGAQSGSPTPVASQRSGSITNKASTALKGTSPSPSSKPSTSPSKSSSPSPSASSGKEPEKDFELSTMSGNKVPMGAIVTDPEGKEDMGVVVSPVGHGTNPDAVVYQDAKGKYNVADKNDNVTVKTPKAKNPSGTPNKDDKLTVGDVAKAAKGAASGAFNKGQSVANSIWNFNPMNSSKQYDRLNKLQEFNSLSLEEQLVLLEGIDKAKLDEAWSKKYKKSVDCNNPKGFSQKAHCAGRKARQAGKDTSSSSVSERKKSLRNPKDNPCWDGYKPVGTKKKNGKTVPNCVPEGISEGVLTDSVPDNSPARVINKLLSKHFPANDIKGQMDAFFAIPDPRMIKDFRQVRAEQGDKACLRPVLRKYVTMLHPSLQKQINIRESKLNEYGSLDAAKQEIIQAVSNIDTQDKDENIAKKNAELLDKIYTILNKNNVMDRIKSVLPDVLHGEYSEKTTAIIAQELSNAPLTYQEKSQFADNLAKDNVIDAAILISPGIYTVDQLTHGDPVNRKVLDHMKSFGVGQQMKGPLEHALAILSKEISIAGKGDVTVAGEPVEVKAAIGEKKGSGGGRFGETGRLPSREQMLNTINSFEQMKPLMDQALATQKSLNITSFVNLANSANLDPQTRAQLGNKVFGAIFGSEAKPVIDEFNKPNADPDAVRKAYIISNFNWYKNSDMGGEWKYLAAISLVDNSVGVVGSGDDLLRISAYKKNPAIITTDKPQEMLYQFNPKAL